MDLCGRGGGGDGAAVRRVLAEGMNVGYEKHRCLIMSSPLPSFSYG